MSDLFVYSGKCRKGRCGDKTTLKDMHDSPLCVGDIVVCFHDDGYVPDNLTVVVDDRYTTYSDGTHVEKAGRPEAFVMGIKTGFPGGRWSVMRVKSYTDVVNGEHWPQYGFSYREEADPDAR